MAVDKKSQHVGNHGGAYTDIDGMRKQFTIVDHDIKPSVGFSDKPTEGWQSTYRKWVIDEISKIPASLCHPHFEDFTIRGDISKIEWNMTMLTDEGIPLQRLGDLLTITSNRIERYNL